MATKLIVRIAISLSLMWMLCITVIAAFDYLPNLPASGLFLVQVERQRTSNEVASQTNIEKMADQYWGPPKEWQFDAVAYLRWMLLPICLVWLLGAPAYLLLRWITAARKQV